MNESERQQFERKNTEVSQQAQEQMQEILARSATDWEFRQKLLSKPKSAIEEHTGNVVKEDIEIAFVEKQGDATLVLPDYRDPEAELEDDQLAAVAGGGDRERDPPEDTGSAFWYHVGRGAGMILEDVGIIEET